MVTIQRLFRILSLSLVLGLAPCVVPSHATSWSSVPHLETIRDGFRYGLPPQIEKGGLVFASTAIPINRADVRDRILHEINYLLLDRRSRVLLWLSRVDSFGPVVVPILKKYKIPTEFIYLAAIESSFNGRALSSAGAFGYWQFIKATAQKGPVGCVDYDWKMNMTSWRDERGDLVRSTHAAARYLTWMNRAKKVSLDESAETEGFNDWLLSAAAYNAGPSKVLQRMNSFKASSYWDVPLPKETEQYVPRWIALGIISKNREYYGVQLPPSRTINFDTLSKVILVKDLSMAAMARLLGTTPRAVWELNTSVHPEKGIFPARSGRNTISHTIHVPKGTSQRFLALLATHGYTKKK